MCRFFTISWAWESMSKLGATIYPSDISSTIRIWLNTSCQNNQHLQMYIYMYESVHVCIRPLKSWYFFISTLQYLCIVDWSLRIDQGLSRRVNKYLSTFADVPLCQLLIRSQMPNLEAIWAFNDASYMLSGFTQGQSSRAKRVMPWWVKPCLERGSVQYWQKIYWEHLFVWESITMAGSSWGASMSPLYKAASSHPYAQPSLPPSFLQIVSS